MARPSEYNLELCNNICNSVAEGSNIIKVLESDESYPCWSTFRRWKQDNRELQTLYIKSIQDKAEYVDYEIDQIQKELKDDKLSPSAANVLIQTLKWKAAKYYPKMFGDKVEHDVKSSDGTMSPNIPIDLSKLTDKELIQYEELQSKIESKQ